MTNGTKNRPELVSLTPRIEVLEKYDIHPVAGLWPLLGEADLQELAMDIKSHGLLEPIWLYRDQLIDGRNRLVACDMAGVEPVFQKWKPSNTGETVTTFILSKNLHRRHLSASVRATVGVQIEEWLIEDKARAEADREKIAANFSVSKKVESPDSPIGSADIGFSADTGEGEPATAETEIEESPATDLPTGTPMGSAAIGFGIGDAAMETTGKGRSRDQAADLAGVSSGYLADAKDIKRADPVVFGKVAAGEMTIPKAQEAIVDEARQRGEMEQLGLRMREGAIRAAEERLDKREKKAKEPRIALQKFSKVSTSRVAITIEATFGSMQKAEEILNKLQIEPGVLRMRYDVKP